MKLDILNKKQAKHINAQIQKRWGASFDTDYTYLHGKDKIFITTRDLAKIPFDSYRVNSCGLYIAEYRNNEIRLSIEGSQLIGPQAETNVVDLPTEQAWEWMRGKDIETSHPDEGFVIIRCGEDYLGSGKVKDGRILNYVPKTRRIQSTS
mgnify:CR=1 FL=1